MKAAKLKNLKLFVLITFLLMGVAHQKSQAADVTWDLGASAGNYGGASYTEVNLGLNWFLADYLIWRNALFGRFAASENLYGLDTSLRLQHYSATDGGGLGLGFFGGPGIRIAQSPYSAMFLEGGLILKLGGLNIGGGAKQFYYTNPGQDTFGNRLPTTDTVFFLILSGGGTL